MNQRLSYVVRRAAGAKTKLMAIVNGVAMMSVRAVDSIPACPRLRYAHGDASPKESQLGRRPAVRAERRKRFYGILRHCDRFEQLDRPDVATGRVGLTTFQSGASVAAGNKGQDFEKRRTEQRGAARGRAGSCAEKASGK